jgi:LPXTG-motif cell wall-anchored protein
VKKFLRGLATAALFGIALSPFAPATAAQAGHFHTQTVTPTPSGPSFETCANLKGWYVNPDETSRKPTATVNGLEFKNNQLIHRATDVQLKNLTEGSYALAAGSDAPDQPSFFSVEVRNGSKAYGTLRWNTTGTFDGKWSITIGAGTGPDGPATDGTFAHDDPVTLLTGKVTKWGAFDPTTAKVVSFGVGYTNSPPGTKTVVVKRVNFKGQYDLTCPPVQPSASASAPQSPTPAPSGGGTPSTRPVGQDTLPLTGTKPLYIAGLAGVILILGGSLAIWGRRRKTQFEVAE